MDVFNAMQGSDFFTWVVLPVLIFCARIADQSIGTLRLILLSKGFRLLAPLLGFFEVIIWLLAVSQIMKHLDNFMCYIAYGAGFAMGNYIGIMLDQKLSLGMVIIRIILREDDPELLEALSKQDYGLTIVDGQGARSKVKVLFSTIKRKDTVHFLSVIHKHQPDAFYTIEEVKSAAEGVFRRSDRKSIFDSFSFRLMKSK